MHTIAITGLRGRRGQDAGRRRDSLPVHQLRDRGRSPPGRHACPGAVHPAIADDGGDHLGDGVLSAQWPPHTERNPRKPQATMRVAINLLTENPQHPSGAHWFWTRVIPEIAKRLEHGRGTPPGREPHVAAPVPGYGPDVKYITFPWSNERRNARTASEHLYSPVRLPLSRIDVFNTLMAPLVNPTCSVVMHLKTMHAFTTPGAIGPAARLYRQTAVPALGEGRRRDHHQLRELALGGEPLPGRRPGQAEADQRGRRPRPVHAGRRRPGPQPSRAATASRSRSSCSSRRCGRTRTATGCSGRGRWPAMSSPAGSSRSSGPGGTRSTWPS